MHVRRHKSRSRITSVPQRKIGVNEQNRKSGRKGRKESGSN